MPELATFSNPPTAPASACAAGNGGRTLALLTPLGLVALCLAGDLHAALVFGSAGRMAAQEAARPRATLASVRSAAALTLGDTLSPHGYAVSLAVNTGDGFQPDPTGKRLGSCPAGAAIRVKMATLSGGLAQDLLPIFRLDGSCKEMRTEWVVQKE